MFISKQDTIIEQSVSEQLSSDRLKQKEESVLTTEFWEKQALCLPAVLVKKTMLAYSEECVKISKEAMTYKSGSVMKMSHLMQNLCGVIN